MRLIGITGGIGMGKSTVADYLLRTGERLLDTDQVARDVAQPGTEASQEIREEFGFRVVSATGELDRRTLASIVFQNSDARAHLEGILHPRIRAAWLRQVEQWRHDAERRAFVVIPLLYKTGAEAEFDEVICIACSNATQAARLRDRGWSAVGNSTAERGAMAGGEENGSREWRGLE